MQQIHTGRSSQRRERAELPSGTQASSILEDTWKDGELLCGHTLLKISIAVREGQLLQGQDSRGTSATLTVQEDRQAMKCVWVILGAVERGEHWLTFWRVARGVTGTGKRLCKQTRWDHCPPTGTLQPHILLALPVAFPSSVRAPTTPVPSPTMFSMEEPECDMHPMGIRWVWQI